MRDAKSMTDEEAKEVAERLLGASLIPPDIRIINRVLDAIADGRKPRLPDKTALCILEERYL